MEDVHELARRRFVRLTRKAEGEAERYFGEGCISLHSEVVAALSDLTIDDWCFRQVKDGNWVDVYRLQYDPPPDAWIKICVERLEGYPAVVVISFHEFDE